MYPVLTSRARTHVRPPSCFIGCVLWSLHGRVWRRDVRDLVLFSMQSFVAGVRTVRATLLWFEPIGMVCCSAASTQDKRCNMQQHSSQTERPQYSWPQHTIQKIGVLLAPCVRSCVLSAMPSQASVIEQFSSGKEMTMVNTA